MGGGPGVTGEGPIETNLEIGLIHDTPITLYPQLSSFIRALYRIHHLEEYVTMPQMRVGVRMEGNKTIIAPLEGTLLPLEINPHPYRALHLSAEDGLPIRFEAERRQISDNLGFHYFSIGEDEFYIYDSKYGLHLITPERPENI